MNFKLKSRSAIKNKIIENNLLPYECNDCKLTEWNNKPISLHLDHINGNNKDNRLENLRFLCPNCHSQTETYCGRNIVYKYGIKNQKVSDDLLLESMKLSKKPIHALNNVGLSGAGNYQRVYRLAKEHGINHMLPPTNKEFNDVYEFSDKEAFDKLNEYNNNYRKTAKYFGCSDNTIRKRIKRYVSNGGTGRI